MIGIQEGAIIFATTHVDRSLRLSLLGFVRLSPYYPRKQNRILFT